jgi:hypothetical protein
VPDELDEFLDALSPALRRKALDQWGEKIRAGPDLEERPPRKLGYWRAVFGFMVSFIWGLPLAAVGVGLIATVVFAPIGFPILIASGLPLKYMMCRLLEHREAKLQERSRDLPEGNSRF